MKYMQKVITMVLMTGLLIVTLAFAQATKQYVNSDYGFQLQVPITWQQTDKQLDRTWHVPNVIEVLSDGKMKLMIRRAKSVRIDSSYMAAYVDAQKKLDAMMPGMISIEKEPELIKLGEITAIMCQRSFSPLLGAQFDFSVEVEVGNENNWIALTYYSTFSDKDMLLTIAEKSYQTFKFIPTEGASEATTFDIWDSAFSTTLNEALRFVFKQYSWDRSTLEKAIQEINQLVQLPLDFFNPNENIASLVEEDSSEIWKLYLNIFHKANFLKWYPTKSKKIIQPEKYTKFLSESKKILDIKVTQDSWRELSYSLGERGFVTAHSNLGSGLKISEIAAIIDDLTLKSFGGPGAELYMDNKKLSQLNFMLFRMFTGKRLSLDFPKYPILEDNLFLLTATVAIYDIENRIRSHDEILKISTKDFKINVYIHRDQKSFAEAGGQRRAFMKLKDGRCLVHVKVPDSLLNYEASVFRLSYHGEKIIPVNKFEYKFNELLKRLFYLASDLSSATSHELDHALFVSGKGKPKWLAEGQATYFGEMMNELNRAGLEVGFKPESLISVNKALSRSDAMMDILQAFKDNMFSTDREVRYSKLLKDRKNSLINDFRDLVLTPDEDFGNPQRELLNYALSWGLFKTVKYAESQKPEDWARFKSQWNTLASTPLENLRDDVIKGQYDLFFEWIASLVDMSLETRRLGNE